MYSVEPNENKLWRYRAFWERGDTDRPLFGTTINPFPSVRAVKGAGVLTPDNLDIAENVKELEEEWEQWRENSGDAIWSANPLWAFPWYLAIAGCQIERQGDNLWHLPFPDEERLIDRIRFDKTDPWFRRMVQIVRALVEKSGGRYPVGVLTSGPADIMMQVRGAEKLALDFHDDPQMVLDLGQACVRLCSEAFDALFEAVPSYLGGCAGTIRYFWAPEKLVETSEDISFMTKLPMHQRFIVPMHRSIGAQYRYNMVHLHSAQLHTVPNLLDVPEIGAIQITPDFGADMLPHLPLLARILERKPLLIHGVIPVDSVKQLMKALPSRGLAIFCRCDSPQEAASVLRTILQ